MSPIEKSYYGAAGVVNETGNTAVTGEFDVIDCLTATNFALLTEVNASGDALTGVEFPAGTQLRGKFTAFTLTEGKVRAYKSYKPSL
jgi:hypothetical protein